jgi:ribosome-associated translation inhibitor RaiA
VNIVFHAHNAEMPESLQQRAEQAVQKLATRLRRVVDASVRFAEDGPVRRVEIVLRAPRQQPLVAAGSGRLYETALGEALERLASHIAHLKAAQGRRIRVARAVSRTGELERLLAARALAQADGDDASPEVAEA